MTEQEFAAIRERWAWRDRVYSEVPGSDDIVALIRAVEERDAYLHDLTLDGSALSRRAVEEFAAELVEWLKGERGNTPHPDYDELHSGMRIAYGSVIRHIQETVSSTAPDPLPPDQVRRENERLRSALKAIRDQADGWINFVNNCSGPVPTTVSDVVRTFQEMARKGLGEA